jgi:predicted RNase H-like HicB family nuclease
MRRSLKNTPALLKSARGDEMSRRVLLYPGEDGYTVAEVPSLPGCVSQGATRDEALENIREAISLHEEVLRDRGEIIPEDNVELVEVAA